MPPVAFRCPLCESPFQVAAEHQGRVVACPHCGKAVAIPPALPSQLSFHSDESPAPPPSPPWQEPPGNNAEPAVQVREHNTRAIEFDGQAYEVPSLTPQELAAFRRRVNACIFGVAAALLAIVVVGLLLWRG